MEEKPVSTITVLYWDMYNIYQQATNELNMFLLNKVIHLSVAQTRVCLWFKETEHFAYHCTYP